MEDDEEYVLLVPEPEQGGPQRQVGGQVEGHARGGPQRGGQSGRPHGGLLQHRHGVRGVEDLLPDPSVLHGQDGAQDMMPDDDVGKGRAQGGSVEPARQTQRERLVVPGAGSLQLVEDPQALLGEGGGRGALAGASEDRRPGGLHPGEQCGQFGDRGIAEHIAEAQLGLELLAHAYGQFGRQQGVAAHVVEAVVDADGVHREHVREDRREAFLVGGAGPVRRLGPGEHGRGQRPSVHLAVGVEREAGHDGEGDRNHRGRQRPAQLGAGRGDEGRAVHVRRGYQVGVDTAVGRGSGGDEYGVPHPGDRAQRGLDLAEFDAHPANLDLVVGAAEVLDRTVPPAAHQIPRPVHPRAGRPVRVGQEAVGGQSGAFEIAACQADPRGVQLPRRAGRHQPERLVQYVHRGVPHRQSHGRRPWPGGHVGRQDVGGHGVCLGGAVMVVQTPSWPHPAERADGLAQHQRLTRLGDVREGGQCAALLQRGLADQFDDDVRCEQELLQARQRLQLLRRQVLRDRHVALAVVVLVQPHPPGGRLLDLPVGGPLDHREAAGLHHLVDEKAGDLVVPLQELVDEVEDEVVGLLDAVEVVLREERHDHARTKSRGLARDVHGHGVARVPLGQIRVRRQRLVGEAVQIQTREIGGVEERENDVVATVVDVRLGRVQPLSRREGLKVRQECLGRRRSTRLAPSLRTIPLSSVSSRRCFRSGRSALMASTSAKTSVM
nr:hypothetical protein [Streptomyces sp. SID685]